eukprot:m.31359 g.31359  ORF g.31359 m.31359 type:complete len:780 (+) comp16447_c0_seq1:96-2435(+)
MMRAASKCTINTYEHPLKRFGLVSLLISLNTIVGVGADESGSTSPVPTILWTSQPTFGNETLLVWGSALDVGVQSLTVTPLQTSGGEVETTTTMSIPAFDISRTSLKATLPASLANGAYKVCLGSSESCTTINVADPWWWRGDVNLTHVSPGGWLRVFGRLSDDHGRLPPPTMVLSASTNSPHVRISSDITLSLINSTANDATFAIPSDLGIGIYTATIGSSGGWTLPLSQIVVAPVDVWPHEESAAIEVFACSPHAPGPTCGTAAIFMAINKTKASGGGVILLRRGAYRFTSESLDLPPFTVLKGESTGLVSLIWDTELVPLKAVPKYFVGGNSTFAVYDLTISCTRFYNNVIMDGSSLGRSGWVHSRGVRIKRVRIRADCFFRLTERGGPPRRGLSANFTYEQLGSAIQLNGQEYEVTDCDIYASMHGIYLGHGSSSLFNSASVGIVARNTINFGGDCYQIDSSSHVIFEDNSCTGINLFSRGSAAGSTYGGPAASFIYFGRNLIKFVFGGDQEMMTLDGGYAPYTGFVTTSGTDMTFAADPVYPQYCNPPGHCQMVDTNWTGAAAYIIEGQGQGQMRVFAKGGLGFNRTWPLQTPFGNDGGGVALDASSFVSVFERRERSIYRDNVFEDGGPIQLYGGMFHAVVANNTGARIDGFIVEGLNHAGFLPCYFVETLDNNIVEGLNYDGGVGSFSTSGYYNKSAAFSGGMAVALVYRGNSVDNGAWSVQGAVTDVVIEGNTMTNTADWNQFTVTEGKNPDGSSANTTFRIFVRGNTGFP